MHSVTQLLNRAYLKGGATREDVVAVLSLIDWHIGTKKTPLSLSVCDWHSLRDCIKPNIPPLGDPDRPNWVRLHFITLTLCLGDLSRSLKSGNVTYWDRLDWLEQIVEELSPIGYVRSSLIHDSDEEFTLNVLPLINEAIKVAKEMGVPNAIARLERYKGRKTFTRCRLLHIGLSGALRRPKGMHATIAFF